ncbi:hypothetical protein [Prochlorothrix hollandica]|nr:hypothetical protein [Prochlorothrix hollandica]
MVTPETWASLLQWLGLGDLGTVTQQGDGVPIADPWPAPPTP